MIKMHIITKPMNENTINQKYLNDASKGQCDEYTIYNPLKIEIQPQAENLLHIDSYYRHLIIDINELKEIRFEMTED